MLAEYHTHPPVTEFSPPSAQDLYQLVLAVVRGDHNCSYVVAREGVYVCRVRPELGDTVLNNMKTFLALHDGPEAIRHVMNDCEQPHLDRLAMVRDHTPTL